MFCERCGNRLEPDDVFCPECGTRVSAPEEPAPTPAAPAPAPYTAPAQTRAPYTAPNSNGWYIPEKKSAFAGVGSTNISDKLSGSMSGGIMNLIPAILGLLMLIWTFLPFISIKLGKLGELASMFGETQIGDMKFNLYQVRKTISSLIALDGDEDAKIVSVLLTVLVIYVVATCIIAIVSGLLDKKGLMITSGVMSSVCLLIWLAYVIAVAHYKAVLFSEIEGEFGYDFGGMMPSIHGAGLILLMITLAAHIFFSFRKASQM